MEERTAMMMKTTTDRGRVRGRARGKNKRTTMKSAVQRRRFAVLLFLRLGKIGMRGIMKYSAAGSIATQPERTDGIRLIG
ncbi:hypothetical protein GWI33_013283 [Rhynchophorus ferrugineus]|uniref:Uncharacterized protein n=1 Tax=Rhynchophorus ferrugineus TaxID=354439 RepID=A0A834IHB3_RHYFE|nr:hypothetical protein GWI33_013283 [Rhynchophorus ferrugineus]